MPEKVLIVLSESPSTTEDTFSSSPCPGISRSDSPVIAATPTSSAVRSASISTMVRSLIPVTCDG